MIQIKIDKKNVNFRDLHFDKVHSELEELLKNEKCTTTFEYEILKWIEDNLEKILLSTTNDLRKVIQNFNLFIDRYNDEVYLTLSNISLEKSKKVLRTISLENLKKVTDYNESNNIDNSSKKEIYIKRLMNINSATIPIPNEFRFKVLKERINFKLSKIFIDFYSKEWDKIKGYDRYTFVSKHNLKTCPYCNMGYILLSKRDENKKNGLRPEIDHFFPKATYPYLAMSFYNLIPSCKVCNHTKSSKDTFVDGLLSPYEINSSTFKLTYTPKNMNFLQIKKRKYNFNSFDIKFKKIDEHSNSYFKLDKLYEQHKDVVLELLIKRTIYSKSYIEELKRNFHFTDDEIYRFLFCNYKESDEFDKRPLSKLIKDITDELGFVRVGIR